MTSVLVPVTRQHARADDPAGGEPFVVDRVHERRAGGMGWGLAARNEPAVERGDPGDGLAHPQPGEHRMRIGLEVVQRHRCADGKHLLERFYEQSGTGVLMPVPLSRVQVILKETTFVVVCPFNEMRTVTVNSLPLAFFGTNTLTDAVPPFSDCVCGIDAVPILVVAEIVAPLRVSPSLRVTGKASESSLPALGFAGTTSGLPTTAFTTCTREPERS